MPAKPMIIAAQYNFRNVFSAFGDNFFVSKKLTISKRGIPIAARILKFVINRPKKLKVLTVS